LSCFSLILAGPGRPKHTRPWPRSWPQPSKPKPLARKAHQADKKPACKTPSPAKQPTPVAAAANEIAKPTLDDPDRERILRLQEALDGIVHGKVLGRLRVGMRVEDLLSGRTLFGWRSSALMDPASNQKVLATSAALLRLGSTYRYRTEVTGARPNAEGIIAGNLVIRGSGDPSLRPRHIEALAESLAERGVTRVSGDILGDPRRIGSDEVGQGGRSPLRVGASEIEVHVRPGDKAGSRPAVSIRPASDAFVVVNQAETRAKGKARLTVAVERAGHRFQVVVGGKISIAKGEVVIHRPPPSQPLFAAIYLRHALVQAGIEVRGSAGVYSGEGRDRVSSRHEIDGALLALAPESSDVPRLSPHVC
jgi:D-alanyl-D-alanine carboxypeptidase/D-alanyl-D-alanine-endopeptidase (penicillin-binding protein 4)